MTDCGVVYVAYGEPARTEASKSIATLRRFAPGLPWAVVSDSPLPNRGGVWISAPDRDKGARQAKLAIYDLSPFGHTLYLDADTRLAADPSAGFALLADGWEVALAPSQRQGTDVLGNLTPPDRAATLAALGPELLGLQAGVLFFRKCAAVGRLFAAWADEWATFKALDQGALLRALAHTPVRLWLLGAPWNSPQSGGVVRHLFGKAAR